MSKMCTNSSSSRLQFCGDFFFDPPSRSLTYSGIYRFLNNPERVLGLAGVWGVALITWNPAIFYLATTAHVLNLAFLQFVEKPHVIKVSKNVLSYPVVLHRLVGVAAACGDYVMYFTPP
jgi:hypothetical protein